MHKNAAGCLFGFAAAVAYARPPGCAGPPSSPSSASGSASAASLVTQSRQAMAGLAVALVVIVMRTQDSGRERRSKVILLAVRGRRCGVVLVMVRNQIASGNEFNSFFQRVDWFSESMRIWQTDPLFGVGLRWWYTDRFEKVPAAQRDPGELSTAGLFGLVGLRGPHGRQPGRAVADGPKYGVRRARWSILSRLVQGQLDLFWVAVQTSVPFLIVGICLGAQGRELAERPPECSRAARRATAGKDHHVTALSTARRRPRLLHQRLRRGGAARQRARRRPGAAGHRVTSSAGSRARVRAVAGDGVRVLPGHAHPGGAAQPPAAARPARRRQRPHDRRRGGRRRWRGWLRGVPVVSTRHFASPRGTRRLTRPVTRSGTRRVDAQIAVSQYVADHVDGPSTVVLSGVRPEPDRVAGGRPEPGRPGRAAARAGEAHRRRRPRLRRLRPRRHGLAADDRRRRRAARRAARTWRQRSGSATPWSSSVTAATSGT